MICLFHSYCRENSNGIFFQQPVFVTGIAARRLLFAMMVNS